MYMYNVCINICIHMCVCTVCMYNYLRYVSMYLHVHVYVQYVRMYIHTTIRMYVCITI